MVRRKYSVNESVFLDETADAYYLLGAFMADGVVSNIPRSRYVSLNSKDLDWLESVRDLISPGKPIYHKKCGTQEFKISNQNVLNWFLNQGCIPNKSLTLEMPQVPSKYLPDFVRGYMDGDGSVSVLEYTVSRRGKQYTYPKFNCYICSGSKAFIDGLAYRIKQVGFKPSIIQTKKATSYIQGREISGGGTWRISFGDRSAIKFTDWTHYTGHNLHMARKFEKITEAREIWENKCH